MVYSEKMKFKEDKKSLVYQLREQISRAAVAVVGKSGVKLTEVVLKHPVLSEHGDYSTNIALVLSHLRGGLGRTPWDLANEIVNAWRSSGLSDYVAKIEVASPGFINIWLANEYLISQVSEVLKKKANFGKLEVLKGKKILLEHTSPNPQTTIHLGHLRNNFLGMATANILEFLGAKLTRDCINNDRGVHLCKAIWSYLIFGQRNAFFNKKQLLEFKKITNKQIRQAIAKVSWQEKIEVWEKKKTAWWQPKDLKLKPDYANLIWYSLGARAYEISLRVQKQVEEILLAWEKEDKKVWKIWRQLLDWSVKGYAQTYKRIGSVHDWVWHESQHYKQGKEIVEMGLKKGIFQKSQGAVVTNLREYGLPDTVVVKADGTSLYITQDLALTRLKIQKFPADLYIWDIGEEQSLYFKQLFAVCEQLGFGKKEKFFHLAYALINFKGGKKMSTRKGEVIPADEILDELHQKALKIIQSSNQKLRGRLSAGQLKKLAEKVAVGAIKYSLLKFARETTIFFDSDESLALEGSSGPYLQYTYTRTQSVLAKSQIPNPKFQTQNIKSLNFNSEEIAILRLIYKFPEVVLEAGKNFAPNLICNYLYELASQYNFFYNKYPILNPKVSTSEVCRRRNPTFEVSKIREFRLALNAAVGQIIKNGLNLLGIETPERM